MADYIKDFNKKIIIPSNCVDAGTFIVQVTRRNGDTEFSARVMGLHNFQYDSSNSESCGIGTTRLAAIRDLFNRLIVDAVECA